jgi:hypothetical protein
MNLNQIELVQFYLNQRKLGILPPEQLTDRLVLKRGFLMWKHKFGTLEIQIYLENIILHHLFIAFFIKD